MMKLGLLFTLISAVVAAGGLALSPVASVPDSLDAIHGSAVVPATKDAGEEAFADYLGPEDGQCDLPVAERSGNWTCMTTTKASAVDVVKGAQAALGRSSVSDVDVAAVATGYCTNRGCWDKIDTAHSTYTGNGVYGYNGKQLGTTRLYFKVNVSAATMRSDPFWFTSSRGRKSTTLSMDRLYVSAKYPGGNVMNPRKYAQKTFKAALADVASGWPTPGPSTTEKTVQYVTVAHEASWTDPSSAYPGSWTMWAKSIKMQRQPSGSYYVQGDSVLPANPAGGAWHR